MFHSTIKIRGGESHTKPVTDTNYGGRIDKNNVLFSPAIGDAAKQDAKRQIVRAGYRISDAIAKCSEIIGPRFCMHQITQFAEPFP